MINQQTITYCYNAWQWRLLKQWYREVRHVTHEHQSNPNESANPWPIGLTSQEESLHHKWTLIAYGVTVDPSIALHQLQLSVLYSGDEREEWCILRFRRVDISLRQLFSDELFQCGVFLLWHEVYFAINSIRGVLLKFNHMVSRAQWQEVVRFLLTKDLGNFFYCDGNSTTFVKAPPMVGPTWTRVRFALGLDCLPTLLQGTVSPLPLILCFLHCLCAHVRCPMSMILGLY